MLKNLFIKNIALIASQNIEFEKGLCVLSGETGAEAEAGEEPEANAPFDPTKPVSLQDILAQTVQEAKPARENP